jgi:hypothetical protein
VTGERRRWTDREELISFLRRQLWTAVGSPADQRLVDAASAMSVVSGDASLSIRDAPALDIGIVTWVPR